MKFIISTLLLITSINLSGQPTIGPEAIVNVGENEQTTFLEIDEQTWNSGDQGQNQLWDYSALSTGEVCDYLALSAADSPYYDSFPDSEIYFVCTFLDGQGFISEQHTYYQIEGDILQLSGNVSISITNPSYDSIFTVFTDPLDWGTFPYSYEATSEDSFEARITSYIGDQTIHAIQNGISTHEVDSYGTLITPGGIFENTIRVKRTELAENSISGIPFTSRQESYRYTWYAENENGVILNLDSIVIKDFTGNVLNTSLQGSYRVMGPTSTSTLSISDSDLSVFPNPVAHEINVRLRYLSDYKIHIYRANGEELPFTMLESSDHSCRIKLTNPEINCSIFFISLLHKESGVKISKAVIVN